LFTRTESRMNSLLLSLALLAPTQPPKADPNDVGVLPVGADGKPLNLDFETGDLKDWTAEGDAFKGQPIRGTPSSRGATTTAAAIRGSSGSAVTISSATSPPGHSRACRSR